MHRISKSESRRVILWCWCVCDVMSKVKRHCIGKENANTELMGKTARKGFSCVWKCGNAATEQNRQWERTLRLNFHTLQSSEGDRPHLLVLLIFHIWARTRLSTSTSLLLPSRQWRGKWDLVERTPLILQYFAHHGKRPSFLLLQKQFKDLC